MSLNYWITKNIWGMFVYVSLAYAIDVLGEKTGAVYPQMPTVYRILCIILIEHAWIFKDFLSLSYALYFLCSHIVFLLL